MKRLSGVVIIALAGGLAGNMLSAAAAVADAKKLRPAQRTSKMAQTNPATYVPIAYDNIAGWAGDDHGAAFSAFLKSCPRLISSAAADGAVAARLPALVDVCRTAMALGPPAATTSQARAFFEAHFTPHRVTHKAAQGLLTGYYEPLLDGSRTKSATYPTPIYRRPPDLVNVVAETERGAKAHALTHVRQTPDGRREAYSTRAEIEAGALTGQNLELMYLKNPVDVFFMQVQGSGRIRLPNGSKVRVTYDGKNGHPYTSVGRYLIDTGQFTTEQVSLQSLETWLKADPARGQKAMWQNKSYVFFRELAGAEADGPHGAMQIPLTTGRSLAIDTGYHALGLPVWVASQKLVHATQSGGFHRLMIAQDVGSAIRGPERGDIYFGSGEAAGKLAGITKHPANFIVLLPKDDTSTRTVRP